RKTTLYIREIEKINLEEKEIQLSPQFSHTPAICPYDILVLALGNVTDFRKNPGLHEHALPFKTLGDALNIRNRILSAMEAAATEKDPHKRRQLLTFVVSGGGFSGAEVCAEINDFTRMLIKDFPQIPPEEIQVKLVHGGERLLE